VRAIAAADREQYDRWIRAAEGRGDGDDAESYREALATWERDQGQPREVPACAVCGYARLTPTAKGTARRHQRRDLEAASWDRVRRLRKDLAALQDELDRLLVPLEP